MCSYPYGGSTPLNLARLHASVAHYSLQQDDYQVKIRCLSDCAQVAELVRTVSEDTRKMNEVGSHITSSAMFCVCVCVCTCVCVGYK